MNMIGITGNNIKELRDKKGWSQLELSKLLGVEPATVDTWEKTDDEEISIKNNEYAVLLPILAGENISLLVSKELREHQKKIFELLSSAISQPEILDREFLGKLVKRKHLVKFGITYEIDLIAMGGILASKILEKWHEKDSSLHGSDLGIVSKAILCQELNEIKKLFQEKNLAWDELNTTFSLQIRGAIEEIWELIE